MPPQCFLGIKGTISLPMYPYPIFLGWPGVQGSSMQTWLNTLDPSLHYIEFSVWISWFDTQGFSAWYALASCPRRQEQNISRRLGRRASNADNVWSRQAGCAFVQSHCGSSRTNAHWGVVGVPSIARKKPVEYRRCNNSIPLSYQLVCHAVLGELMPEKLYMQSQLHVSARKKSK